MGDADLPHPPAARAGSPPEITLTEELTTDAVEIAPDTYWVGRRDPGGIFFANPYLRVFRGGEGKAEPYQICFAY